MEIDTYVGVLEFIMRQQFSFALDIGLSKLQYGFSPD